MNLYEFTFDNFLILHMFCFLWDFSHLLASRACRKQNAGVLVPQIMTCRERSETWCLVVITANFKKMTTPPCLPLLILVLKVLFPTRDSFLSVVSHELVKVGNGCPVKAVFEADFGSCQSTAKWTRLLPLGNCVGEFQGDSLLMLQSLILKQFWTQHAFPAEQIAASSSRSN